MIAGERCRGWTVGRLRRGWRIRDVTGCRVIRYLLLVFLGLLIAVRQLFIEWCARSVGNLLLAGVNMEVQLVRGNCPLRIGKIKDLTALIHVMKISMAAISLLVFFKEYRRRPLCLIYLLNRKVPRLSWAYLSNFA